MKRWRGHQTIAETSVTAQETPPPILQRPLPPIEGNRQQRRMIAKLERARRKHDKLVTPKGPQPILNKPRERRAPKPVAVETAEVETPLAATSANRLVVDKHWEDKTGPNVLWKEEEFYGEFCFRDSILNQLDRYFFYLQRMRKHAPDAYHLYRQIGATLAPYSVREFEDKINTRKFTKKEIDEFKSQINLPNWFNLKRPTFNCVAYGADPRTELQEDQNKAKGKVCWIPKFMYYTKISQPPSNLQPMSGGDIYAMTVWWDRRTAGEGFGNKWGVPYEYAIFVSKDGKKLQVLKQLDYHNWYWREWRVPLELVKWTKELGIDYQTFLCHLFCDTVKRAEYNTFSMIRVAVTKNHLTAVFGISPKRTSYFFQDRDITLNVNGRKQRIFHIVRPHKRVTKTGETDVHMHFRGLKEFDWAGYNVTITVPGRDHFMLSEYDVGCIDSSWKEPGVKYQDQTHIGKMLVNRIRGGLGSWTHQSKRAGVKSYSKTT